MEVREKIAIVLREALRDIEYIRLELDDGVTGIVVSPKFKGMTSIERQTLLEEALRSGSQPLTQDEQRQVLMIAGLTPLEYKSAGSRIAIQRVKEKDGQVEIVLQGGESDAEYVRDAFKSQKGVHTTEPKRVPRKTGDLMSFRAAGTKSDPLNRNRAIRVLNQDPYIAVLPNA